MADRELTVFEHQATCPYCGQAMFVTLTVPNPTEEELTAEAAEKCSCPGATQERGMKATEKAIQRVLGEDSVKIGFDYALDETSIVVIRTICGHILADQIDSVTLREPQGDVVRLIKNGNAVKIRRSCKKQAEM